MIVDNEGEYRKPHKYPHCWGGSVLHKEKCSLNKINDTYDGLGHLRKAYQDCNNNFNIYNLKE